MVNICVLFKGLIIKNCVVMKKVNCLIIIVFSIISICFSSCTKDNTDETGIPNQSDFKLTLVKYAKYDDTDSIFYSNNKVSIIKQYGSSTSTSYNQYRFEYINSEVKIYERDFNSGVGSTESLIRTMIFKDLKLSQIKNSEGIVYANYVYDANKLKYVIVDSDDSLAVRYDTEGKNITEMKWYDYNPDTKEYSLVETFTYIFDNKNNPYKNYIYYPFYLYDDEENSLDYFNTNNILSTIYPTSTINRTYSYNENGYPDYVDRGTDGRIYFEYESN